MVCKPRARIPQPLLTTIRKARELLFQRQNGLVEHAAMVRVLRASALGADLGKRQLERLSS